MDPILIASALAEFVPAIAGWIGGKGAQDVAQKVVDVAQQVTGASAPDAALAAIKSDPNLALQFQSKVLEQQEALAKIANDAEKQELDAMNVQTGQVADVMKEELKNRVFSWRDYWGYVSGTAFAFIVGVVGYLVFNAVYLNHYELLDKVPALIGAFSTLFGIAATVLGVQSSIQAHHTGMAERIKAGQ